MDGSVWHEDPSIIYTGIITKREKYRGRNRELVDGYEVRWCDGNRENWPYESLLPCLVPVMSSFENDDVITVGGGGGGVGSTTEKKNFLRDMSNRVTSN